MYGYEHTTGTSTSILRVGYDCIYLRAWNGNFLMTRTVVVAMVILIALTAVAVAVSSCICSCIDFMLY